MSSCFVFKKKAINFCAVANRFSWCFYLRVGGAETYENEVSVDVSGSSRCRTCRLCALACTIWHYYRTYYRWLIRLASLGSLSWVCFELSLCGLWIPLLVVLAQWAARVFPCKGGTNGGWFFFHWRWAVTLSAVAGDGSSSASNALGCALALGLALGFGSALPFYNNLGFWFCSWLWSCCFGCSSSSVKPYI